MAKKKAAPSGGTVSEQPISDTEGVVDVAADLASPTSAVAPVVKKDIRVRNGKKYIYRRSKTSTARSPEHMDPLWKTLDAKIGGREGLLAAAMASTNPKTADLIPLLLDPSYRKWGTKALAKRAGVSAAEVVDMFRDKKWMEAVLEIHEGLPEVVRDATTDAKASFIPCETCKGLGTGEEGLKCYVCGGAGKLRRPGDKDKLAFVGEAAGLTGKKGPAVQNNIQINAQQQSAQVSFEDLLRRAVVKPKLIEVKSEPESSEDRSE